MIAENCPPQSGLLLDFNLLDDRLSEDFGLPTFMESDLYMEDLFGMSALVASQFGEPSTMNDLDETSPRLDSPTNEFDLFEPLHERQEDDNLSRPQELSEDLFLSYRYMDRILSKPSCLLHLAAVWNEPIQQMFNHYLKLGRSATPNQIMQSIDNLLNKSMRLDEQLRHVYMRFTSYLLDKFDCWRQESDIHLTPTKHLLKKSRLQTCYESPLFNLPKEVAAKLSDCQNGFSISKLQTIKQCSPKLFLEFVFYLKHQYELDDEKCFDQYFSNMSRSRFSKELRQKPRNPHAVRKTKLAVTELIKSRLK
jgi:hypothetical protein